MIDDQLRDAVRESGLSSYEFAKRAAALGHKIDHKAITRFVKKETGINCESFSIIAEVLGMVLVKKGEPVPCDPPPNFHELAHVLAEKMAVEAITGLAIEMIREKASVMAKIKDFVEPLKETK